jgi:hypothetical protein
MAKQIKTTFDHNVLFGAAIQAVTAGADREQAVAAAAAVMKGRTLVECAQAFVAGDDLEEAIGAGKQGAANRAKELLEKADIEMEYTAVRTALIPAFWTQDKNPGLPVAKAELTPEQVKDGIKVPTEEQVAAAAALYGKIYMRAQRMAKLIAPPVVEEAEALRVPKALQTEINEMHARLELLKAQHSAALVAEARKRATDAATAAKKKAKAKAAK